MNVLLADLMDVKGVIFHEAECFFFANPMHPPKPTSTPNLARSKAVFAAHPPKQSSMWGVSTI